MYDVISALINGDGQKEAHQHHLCINEHHENDIATSLPRTV